MRWIARSSPPHSANKEDKDQNIVMRNKDHNIMNKNSNDCKNGWAPGPIDKGVDINWQQASRVIYRPLVRVYKSLQARPLALLNSQYNLFLARGFPIPGFPGPQVEDLPPIPSPPRFQFTPINVKKHIVGPPSPLDRQRLRSSRKRSAVGPSSATGRRPVAGLSSTAASPFAACMKLRSRLLSTPPSRIAKGEGKHMAPKRKGEVDPEGARGMQADEILSSDAQTILGMVNVGKACSALRSDITA